MGGSEFLQRIYKGQDAEVDKWLLMESPVPALLTIAVYLVFVLKVGPAFMKNLQPFKLKKVLLVYNLFQITYNLFMFVQIMKVSRILDTLIDPKCRIERNREQKLEHFTAAWHYVMSKVIDLLDTIFFVLRKKNNQITFLHVYHHAVMIFLPWIGLKYSLGEQLTSIGLLNTFVHVLMYTYYLVAAMGPQYQKYLWWKKYITTIQLAQFAFIITYMIVIALKGCEMSITWTIFSTVQGLLFFYWFFSFYRNTYESKNKSTKVK